MDFVNSQDSGAVVSYRLVSSYEEYNPDCRPTMEDEYRVIPKLPVNGERVISYFGVYDGHGGRGTVDYLKEALETAIVTEINNNQDDGFDLPEFLKSAYLSCDEACCQHLLKTEKTIGQEDVSGATALSALLICGEETFPKALYVANCGDTRGVLCEEIFEEPGTYEAKRLSYDHKATDEDEKIRIKKLGGSVKNGRVMKMLNVARAFGDKFLKKFITAEPFCPDPVLIESAEHCPFFILACDGLWDVISDEDAVNLVLAEYKEKGPFENAAQLLVEKAMELETTDNVTVVVVFL
mmetsp:Transcript_1901/g.3610  ORF Transcript_1901/g.3610 Transcript_1901/m.3610 type:complete len:295 (-) Transcript_1901:1297-2181(-)